MPSYEEAAPLGGKAVNKGYAVPKSMDLDIPSTVQKAPEALKPAPAPKPKPAPAPKPAPSPVPKVPEFKAPEFKVRHERSEGERGSALLISTMEIYPIMTRNLMCVLHYIDRRSD